MRTRMLASIMLVALLVAFTTDSTGALGSMSLTVSPAARARFTFYDVDYDDAHNYGQYPSIAINPLTDLPYVAYYDAAGKKVRLAHMVSSAGNCGYDGRRLAWFCESVPLPAVWSGDDVGRYASLAIYSTGGASPQWKLGIAYFNWTYDQGPGHQGLFYSVYACPPAGSCGWSTSLVDGVILFYGASGRLVSFKFDSAGNPRIAYGSGAGTAVNEIRYARYVGGGSGTGCSRRDWQCDAAIAVYQNSEITEALSLDLDAVDRPHIAYSGSTSAGSMNLRHAWLGTSSGNCGTASNWQCEMVESQGGGTDVSLKISKGPPSIPRIAYYRYYPSHFLEVKFATRGSGGGMTCGGSGGLWTCDNLDGMMYSPGFTGISMSEDSQGYPVIAYRDTDAPGGGRLKWAQPKARLGMSTGNCGYSSNWRCDLVGGPYGAIFGQQASLALNSAGLAYIASYDDTPPGFLEISFQQRQLYLPLTRK